MIFKDELEFESNLIKALSSKDLKQAIKDIKENKIPNVEITETAKKDFQAMQDLSNKLKVNGTPRIIVIDKKENAIVDSIEGANLEAIEKYQKQNN